MSRKLTQRHVQILLVVAERPLHGYAISKEIEVRTDGRVALKPGSLYRALHQLLERACIEEITSSDSDDDRRREYRLTQAGREALRGTLEDMRGLLDSGVRLGILGGENVS